jgi:hypothetical protein
VFNEISRFQFTLKISSNQLIEISQPCPRVGWCKLADVSEKGIASMSWDAKQVKYAASKSKSDVTFKVVAAVTRTSTPFWDVWSCSLVKCHRCLRKSYCFHRQISCTLYGKIIKARQGFIRRSQWHELSSLALTLGSWVRIPFKAWMSVLYAFILCLC